MNSSKAEITAYDITRTGRVNLIKNRGNKAAESEVQSMRTATQTMKFTALYERLSRDDVLHRRGQQYQKSETAS